MAKPFFLTKLLSSVLLCSVAVASHAESDWPSRSIKMVVGYAAGGPVDLGARTYAKFLGEELNQNVIVENKTGAGGVIAVDYTSRAKPDGYTIHLMASPTLTISPHIQKNVRVDPNKDLTALGKIFDYVNMMVVNKDIPANSLEELIDYAKKNPNEISFGSAGVGASNHLSAELLKQKTNAEMLHVPYRGNAPAMVDVISGKLSFMFDIIDTARRYVDNDEVKAFAVTSKERSKNFPDVPTVEESGVDDYEVLGWYSIVTPPDLPTEIKDKLYAAMEKVNKNEDYLKFLETGGYNANLTSGEDLLNTINTEYKMWEDVINKAGIDVN